MLEKVDLFLLNKVEKLGHRFQLLTGKTNFFLSMVCTYIFIALVVWGCFISKHKLSMGTLIMLLLISSKIVTYRYKEDDAFNRLQKGLSNFEKVAPFAKFFRKVTVLVIVAFSILLFLYLSLLWTCIGLIAYLSACDPLPPCKGKIGEMIDAFFAPKLVPIPIKESDK